MEIALDLLEMIVSEEMKGMGEEIKVDIEKEIKEGLEIETKEVIEKEIQDTFLVKEEMGLVLSEIDL